RFQRDVGGVREGKFRCARRQGQELFGVSCFLHVRCSTKRLTTISPLASSRLLLDPVIYVGALVSSSLVSQPSRKCPNAARGRTRSHTILVTASIGTDRIAPGAPHIQNQNTRDTITKTGLRVKRLARSMGVTA